MASQQPNVTAAMTGAAILSGEKSYQGVQFAITGDGETDLIAGILAVINAAPSNATRFSPSTIARVLLYLAGRFAEEQKNIDRQASEMERLNQLSRGMAGTLPAGDGAAKPWPQIATGGNTGMYAVDSKDWMAIRAEMARASTGDFGHAPIGKPLVEVFQDEEKLARDAVKVETIRGMLKAAPPITPDMKFPDGLRNVPGQGWPENDEPGKKI